MLTVLIALALTFGFLNGVNDAANVVATVISSRALQPRAALTLTAIGEFIGPLLFGVAVARVLGEELLDSTALNLEVLVAALVGAIIWNLITWYLGIPSSSSHALVGGLLGAALAGSGPGAVKLAGLEVVLLALILSPPVGLFAGFVATRILFFLARGTAAGMNRLFRQLQILTSFGLAMSHGGNDAQKTMGVIVLGLVVAGRLDGFQVPTWVMLAAAAALALGTFLGGWRVIRTLGGRIMKVRPVHGFAAQAAGAGVIYSAALLGGPVSITQVMSSAIMGAGAAERPNMVRWQVGRDLLFAWLLTIPASGAMAALAWLLIASF